MDKPERTPEEDEQMIRLSLTSHYHWTQREDCKPENESIAYWQTSRIFAILGQAENAHHYAQLSLDASRKSGEKPFLMGYSYEALARAAAVAGNQSHRNHYLNEARKCAQQIIDPEHQKALNTDLDTILT